MNLSVKAPDMLLIMVDQMRADCISLAGHAHVRTPVIDAVGGQGSHFTRAYTTCPSCIPARRCLLTGQSPARGGLVGYQDAPLQAPTLPQLLREAGYATCLAGRHMHQVPYDEPYGYDRQVLGSTYIAEDDYTRFLNEKLPHLGGVRAAMTSFNGWQARPWLLAEDLHPTSWTTAQARRLLATAPESRPLFLTASYYAPHPPLNPPAWYFDYYRQQNLPDMARGNWVDWDKLPSVGAPVDAARVNLGAEALRLVQAGYFGLIHHLDDQLYWLIEDFRGRAQQAGRPWVIVFTSDHGEMLGDHGYFRKCEPYEGSAHIPFLIQGSDDLGFASGQVCNRPVCLEDVMPTLLSLAAAPCPQEVDGIDLVPVLRGEAEVSRPFLHSEHAPCYSEEQAYHMLTDGRWKYIWRPSTGQEQLFDLETDPREIDDCSAGCPDRLVQWRNNLIRHLNGRPEGFSDGSRLYPGRAYTPLLTPADSLNNLD